MWPAGYTQVKVGKVWVIYNLQCILVKCLKQKGKKKKTVWTDVFFAWVKLCLGRNILIAAQLFTRQTMRAVGKSWFFRTAQWVLIALRGNILLMVWGFSAAQSPKLLVRFSVGETQSSPQDYSTSFHSLHQLKNTHPECLKKSSFEPEIYMHTHICI